jgi:metallo-beta-lactamase family protein
MMADTHCFHPPRFIHHGAVHTVTGSCHQYLLAEHYTLLIDCGLFQGDELGVGSDQQLNGRLPFALSTIKALILTHVHLDHCGRLPQLYAAGYRGPIYLTQASALLLPLALRDALKTNSELQPEQINLLLDGLLRLLRPCDYSKWQQLPAVNSAKCRVECRFQPAGHILGSAYVEIRHQVKTAWFKTVFSGDLGPPDTPLLPTPKAPASADILVLESTYGDRCHQGRQQRQQQLQQVIARALQDNGTILIPAFSLGRTQELLYELEDILHRLRAAKIHPQLSWSELAVIVDSPLAIEFTHAYRQLQQYWDKAAKAKLKRGRQPLAFLQLTYMADHQQHLALVNLLASTASPAIVIAGGGMCNGGRIVDYLQAMLADSRHQILFVGYQAKGTAGAAIIAAAATGASSVRFKGQLYPLRAEVLVLSGYSAHADQQDLLRFVRQMKSAPRQIRLVHGDQQAKQALQLQLQAQGYQVLIAD